jgi:hypothetical protein
MGSGSPLDALRLNDQFNQLPMQFANPPQNTANIPRTVGGMFPTGVAITGRGGAAGLPPTTGSIDHALLMQRLMMNQGVPSSKFKPSYVSQHCLRV